MTAPTFGFWNTLFHAGGLQAAVPCSGSQQYGHEIGNDSNIVKVGPAISIDFIPPSNSELYQHPRNVKQLNRDNLQQDGGYQALEDAH